MQKGGFAMKRWFLVVLVFSLLLVACISPRSNLPTRILITGQLYGDSLAPLEGIVVDLGRGYPYTVTDQDGDFSLEILTAKRSLTIFFTDPKGAHLPLEARLPLDGKRRLHLEEVRLTAIHEPLFRISGRLNYLLPEGTVFSATLQEETLSSYRIEPLEGLILYIDPVTEESIKVLLRDLTPETYQANYPLGILTVKKPAQENLEDFYERAALHPLVKKVTYNQQVSVFSSPTEAPLYSHQWNMDRIYMPEAWSFSTGKREVLVAVLDNGVDIFHQNLVKNLDLTRAYNAIHQSQDVHEPLLEGISWHGSHVTGIVSAYYPKGVTGVSPVVTLIPVKVLHSNGLGNEAGVAEGIRYAIEQGVDVINLSLGARQPMPLVEAQIKEALLQGIIVVAAAGNSGPHSDLNYPAAYEGVLSVGATNAANEMYRLSVLRDVDIFAPGEGIYSTSVLGEYLTRSGTSMSSPHIAGLAALWSSLHPKGNADAFREDLLATSHLLACGNHFVNAQALLSQSYLSHAILRFQRSDETLFAFRRQVQGRDFQVFLPEGSYHLEIFIDLDSNNQPSKGEWVFFGTLSVTKEEILEDLVLAIW